MFVVDTPPKRSSLEQGLLDLTRPSGFALGEDELARKILGALGGVFGEDAGARLVLPVGTGYRVYAAGADGGAVRCSGLLQGPLMDAWVDDPTGISAPPALAPSLALREEEQWTASLRGEGSAGVLLVRRLVGGREEHLRHLAEQARAVIAADTIQRRWRQEAETDGLTGVGNYRAFLRALGAEFERCAVEGESLTVVMVDVDNLKYYNDRFGHLGGSVALRELAELVRRQSRAIDVVAKYGGDEFCVLLPHCDRAGAVAWAERVRMLVQEHAFERDPGRRLTVSMGIAVHPSDGVDARDLLRIADERLYEAKTTGRNRLGTP